VKILAIKFKYLGDVVIMTPALRALREHYPQAALHVLVAEEAAPMLRHLDWIDRVWALPRTRGKTRLSESLPLIKTLRREEFDRSVDFVGNDRGAWLSRLIGAKIRLGMEQQRGPRLRRLAYTETREELDHTRHEVIRDLHLLSAWDVPCPPQPKLMLAADPALAAEAESWLPGHPLLFHLSTSQTKKEWPLGHWKALWQKATAAGESVVFSSGPSQREQALLSQLQALLPEARILPVCPSLDLFLAILARAKRFVSPDTAPLHLAAGLGVPTLGLFGPTAASRWAPLGETHRALQGGLCPCSGHLHTCAHTTPCIATLDADQVWQTLQPLLTSSANA
jgi:heptosyltransferase-3